MHSCSCRTPPVQVRLLGILRDRQATEKSSTSGLIARAERRAGVIRTLHPDDGRVVHVALTGRGGARRPHRGGGCRHGPCARGEPDAADRTQLIALSCTAAPRPRCAARCAWVIELKGTGVRVNLLSPGAVNTPSLRLAFAGASGADQVDARVKAMGDENPLGRLVTTDDVAKAAVFLSS